MQIEIDRYTTQDLCGNLGRKRPTLADWCKALNLKPLREGKRAVYTLGQVEELEALRDYLDFDPRTRTIADYLAMRGQTGQLTDKSPTLTPSPLVDAPTSTPTIPMVVLRVLALRALVEAADLGVLLTTAEIAEAVGRPPTFLHGSECSAARGFHFQAAGKEGKNRLWRVERSQRSHPALSERLDRCSGRPN